MFCCFLGVTFQFKFLLCCCNAASRHGIFGYFGLSIVPDKQQVLHAAKGRTFTKASTSSFISPSDTHTAAAVAELPPQVQQLLAELPTLMRPGTDTPKPLHGYPPNTYQCPHCGSATSTCTASWFHIPRQ
jgi:hypothetical protein